MVPFSGSNRGSFSADNTDLRVVQLFLYRFWKHYISILMYHSIFWSFFEDFCTYLCSKSAQRRKTSRMQAAFCKIYNEPRRIFTFLQSRIVHTFNTSDFDTIDVKITIFRGFLSSSTKEFFYCRSNQMLLKFRKTFPEGHWNIWIFQHLNVWAS